MSAFATLPPLYTGWLRDLLGAGGEIPDETEATCSACAMLPPPDAPATGSQRDGDAYYSPKTKCCTYLPTLANFLVGGVLEESDPALEAGRASVRQRIAARGAVTPRALGVTSSYSVLYEGTDSFGRSEAMRCPHYLLEGGRCGVWRHREATCLTWFCKHVRGSVGSSFWMALKRFLTAVEHDLSIHCLVSLGFEGEPLAIAVEESRPRSSTITPAPDAPTDPAVYRRRWGTWVGREEELYRRAAGVVAGLRWDDVARIGGVGLRASSMIVRHRFAAFVSTEIPKTLRAAPVQIVPVNRLVRRVRTYLPTDPIDLPAVLVEALAHFDGRPTAEVLQELEREDGLVLEEDLVRRLVDFEVLVSVDGA